MTDTGILKDIKMVHVSGLLKCSVEAGWRWGCNLDDGKNYFATVITNAENTIIFPQKGVVLDDINRFEIPVYKASTATSMKYGDLQEHTYIQNGTELRIWFGEDLKDVHEDDNSGKHCVDVYAKMKVLKGRFA